MSTISTRTLAAYCLILGLPIVILVELNSLWYSPMFDRLSSRDMLFPIYDAARDFDIWLVVVDALRFIGALAFLFGLWVIHGNMKEEEKGYNLTRLGLFLLSAGVVFGFIAVEIGNSAAHHMNMSKFVIIFTIGVILFGLGLSTRDEHNKTLAYAVVFVTAFTGLFFLFGKWSGGASSVDINSPFAYAVTSAAINTFWLVLFLFWSITLGLKLRKAARFLA